ncbi:PucR family transcriptional regulator [Paenibacillus sp. MBLB4367]|uniref:PucR family transcriptional regulator n=1 Tax=Paenibacillus sp. MBLB4367 TaxID=3384767 RepID=UPI00390838BA
MNRRKNVFDGHFDSLETLADAISEVLQCPITIEDAGHRLLAYSSHDRQIDPARTATIVGRRVPEHVIQSLWQGGIMHRLLQSPEPVKIEPIDNVGLGRRVAVAVRKNEDVLGYIWVMENERELDAEALGHLSKAALAVRTKLLHHRMLARQEEEGRQEFFWQMLTGHLNNHETIRDKAKQLGLALPGAYTVIVMQFSKDVGDIQQQLYDMMAVRPNARVVLRAVDRNRLILLFGVEKEPNPEQTVGGFIVALTAQFSERLAGQPEVTGGAGSFYSSYALVEAGYREALTVLDMKPAFFDKLRSVHVYHELGLYRYLPGIWQHKEKHPFEHRGLAKLREYDRYNNGCLTETLERFLACDSNAKEAAVSLHVHTNTLTYRLKRISEIGGIDLDDADQKIAVYLELQAEKYGKLRS